MKACTFYSTPSPSPIQWALFPDEPGLTDSTHFYSFIPFSKISSMKNILDLPSGTQSGTVVEMIRTFSPVTAVLTQFFDTTTAGSASAVNNILTY